jgi:hypothetical protein
MKIKEGDLIHAKYEWDNKLRKGIGYVYKAINLHVGLSCKNGGCSNIPLEDLREVKKIQIKILKK